MRALLAGETVSHDGRVRVDRPRLWTLPETPPPLVGPPRGVRVLPTGSHRQQAYTQHQIDTYGHILDAAFCWQEVTGGLTAEHLTELWRIVDALGQRWREPDHGIGR